MVRNIVVAALILAMCSQASGAVAGRDLSGVKCEDQKAIDFIKTSLLAMHTVTGRSIISNLSDNSKLTATTIYARQHSFACRIRVNMEFGYGTEGIVGKFTYREFPGAAKPTVEFLPGY